MAEQEFSADEMLILIGQDEDKNLELIADETVADIQQSISIQASVPSNPGEPPHFVSGDLYKSIQRTDVIKNSVEVFTEDFKAKWLELGIEYENKNGTTVVLEARPFFEPAFERLKKRVK